VDPHSDPHSDPTAPIPLTVLIRTLNEADRIAAAIRSALPLNCEILVIDAGSTDATVSIAEALGARVVVNPWTGFGPQRRFGEALCRHDHVFSVDADEILTPEIVREIRGIFQKPAIPPLMIVRKAMVLPHHARPSPWAFCTENIYLYDRRVARTTDNPNWDKLAITTDAKPVTIRSVVWHHTFRDWNHAIAKSNYVGQLAADTQPIGSRFETGLRLVFEYPLNFLKFYVLRRFFLAGLDGFVMASVLAYGRFIRIAKMHEATRGQPSTGLPFLRRAKRPPADTRAGSG
jgi:glycosyltransferase involved in cell wall biosynthesis